MCRRWRSSTGEARSGLAAGGDFFSNPVTWKGMGFLLLKFPLGVVSFVATVTLLSGLLAFLLAPLFWEAGVFEVDLVTFQLDSLGAAWACCSSASSWCSVAQPPQRPRRGLARPPRPCCSQRTVRGGASRHRPPGRRRPGLSRRRDAARNAVGYLASLAWRALAFFLINSCVPALRCPDCHRQFDASGRPPGASFPCSAGLR